MITIEKATAANTDILLELARETFIQSHGASASAEDIAHYVADRLNADSIKAALQDASNHYYLLLIDAVAMGFSNIIFNQPVHVDDRPSISKLERLYLLKEVYNTGSGKLLLEHNIALARQQQQQAIWLNVWTENERALNFYIRNGFRIIGTTDFFISPTHSNPNYVMQLNL